MKNLALVVLISGRGSNLKAIIEAQLSAVDVCAVISNRSDAKGLAYAEQASIPTHVIVHKQYPTRETFDRALQACIDVYQPDLIALAGFMRVLTPDFVTHYRGRLINIHPSLLPAFRGLHTHERALESGVKEHGASVHFVTEDLDAGPLIQQARVPVLANDTPDSLAARVLATEHRIYPQVIQWFAQGRLQLRGHRAFLDGQPITFSSGA
jgi:phosphoribosylglycinamide formyltransferase-1